MLLDLHPQPEHPKVEVLIGDRSIDIGLLDESEAIGRINAARRVLASIVREGLFLKEEETEFEFVYYFDSVDECKSYLVAEEWGDPVSNDAVIEPARDLLSQGEGKILMRDQMQAARLRRLG